MRHFTASDGARMAYRDEGEGRPLLFLHGLMAHGGFFDRQAELARDFRCIVVDLRGHGQSSSGRNPLTLARLAADIGELVASLDLRHVVGIGWSLGASVLFHLLTQAQAARFDGAVIVDMTPRVRNGGDWTLGLEPDHCAQRTTAIAGDFPAFSTAAGHAIFADQQRSKDDAAWAAEQFGRNDPDVIGALWTSLADTDFRPLLSGIKQPTLILHGALSHLYGRETSVYLAEAIPGARRISFDQAGHAPHMEQPALFNQIVRDFADALPPISSPKQC